LGKQVEQLFNAIGPANPEPHLVGQRRRTALDHRHPRVVLDPLVAWGQLIVAREIVAWSSPRHSGNLPRRASSLPLPVQHKHSLDAIEDEAVDGSVHLNRRDFQLSQ
jgi:hypothetical protein